MARYVIFTESLFTVRDWDRFGCSEFSDAGYEVVCIEVSKALGTAHRLHSRGRFQSIEAAVAPDDFEALDRLIAALTRDDVVLMQVLLSAASLRFFRALHQHRVNYAVVTMGPLPISKMRKRRSALSLSEYLAFKCEDLRGTLSRLKKFATQLAMCGVDYLQLQPPSIWLAVGGESAALGTYWPRLWSARRVSVPSHDYITARELAGERGAPAGTAVFLDEAFPDHPDFELLGRRSPVTRERYWASLEGLFKAIEAKTGLSVIIAPHPKSSHDAPVNPHRWVKGRTTGELVRNCALVISHCSTAVSFGVAFRKPIMFVTTDEVETSLYRGAITRMSSYFGQKRINADRFSTSELDIPVVDEKIYQSYEHDYLKAPDAVIGSPWTALRNEMKKNEH